MKPYLYCWVCLLCTIVPALAEQSISKPPRFIEVTLTRDNEITSFTINGKPLQPFELRRLLPHVADIAPDEPVHLFVEDAVPSEDLIQVLTLLHGQPDRTIFLVPQPKLIGPENPVLKVRMEKTDFKQITPKIVTETEGLTVVPYAGVFRNAVLRNYSEQQLLSVWTGPDATIRQRYVAAVSLVEAGSDPEAVRHKLGHPGRQIQTTLHISSSLGEKTEPILMWTYHFPAGNIVLDFLHEGHTAQKWALTKIDLLDTSHLNVDHHPTHTAD